MEIKEEMPKGVEQAESYDGAKGRMSRTGNAGKGREYRGDYG